MQNIVIIGGTGVGKDYIASRLREIYLLNKVVTVTTRPIRKGEVDGESYHFTNNKDFKERNDRGEFLEHQVYATEFGTWFYGTTLASIRQDKTIIILDKDGFLEYKKHIPNCISFYISCIDETERFYKALSRLGENVCKKDIDELYRRIKVDEEKFKDIDKMVDFVVPQLYNKTTMELIFDLLDRLGIEKR
ncbi:MAG: hypothetical protein ACRDDY_04190 [Clostridium sp.]|uniref:hypothetical protein n=1 Tax=Clostridium sp. TaxID=1506 RepID=UPI003EE46B30